MGVSEQIKRVELPNGSQWINDDVRPVNAERRTWTFLAYHNFWLLINCNIATFLTGSALIPLGLTWWQAIICIIVGNLLATGAILLASMAGAYYHIGFPVFSRAVWGLWGAQFVVWNRIFLSLVWYGFQSWVGGECIYLIILSWDPGFEGHIHNTIPADTGMTSAQFLCYFIFCIISLPLLMIQPHRLQKFFYFTSTITLIFFVVLLIWALATMGPRGFGDTISSGSVLPATGGPDSVAWLMIMGIMSTIGSIAAGILNQNDYARLARRPGDAIWGQAFAFPFYGIFASILGILVTAATQDRMGEAIWNPPTLFVRLLEKDNSAGTRAAVFFSGLALVVSQIGSNLPGNALAGGIDLSSVFPRYINIRRGAYITAILSPIVNPWRLVNTATIFLTVLSSYGVFLAPMTGLMVASYLVVCKQKLNVDDLYRGDKGSIYWYTWGVNWRAPVAWIVGVVPCLPGFIAAVDTSVSVSDGATELYYTNYMYGFLSSALVYSVLHFAFPDARSDDFVRNSPSARDLQQQYQSRWDDVTLAETPELHDDSSDSHKNQGLETTTRI
ncbi:NCS1 nucleoside transporter family protein [Ilyonectria robusta]|uniref:NCS1 nucleoside transporter family protein n=1 Tax=Ilyonectria robusta TaxID=1079257 RepID=UPI001E8E7383|nr:NCS1 nucleoside transporter family protein [Ilyonectria robusta]KAH8714592.1 NCS1 nucleoside transporter family protein [Ilyonectria robusta]